MATSNSCPSCGAVLLSGSLFCPSCGRTSGAVAAAAAPKPKFCSGCGTEIRPNATFCATCGAAVNAQPPAALVVPVPSVMVQPYPMAPPPQVPKKKRWHAWQTVLLIVALGIAIFTLLFALSHPSYPYSAS
jgi:uncharacterized membrane protein YvbJ